MKKLMIAAAIVCAAAISQATVVNWGLSNIASFNGTALGSQAVQFWIVGVNTASDLQIDSRNTVNSPANKKGQLASNAGSMQSGYNYKSTIAGGAVATENEDHTWSDVGREYFIKLTYTDTGTGTEYTYTSSIKESSGLSEKGPGSLSFTFNDKIIASGTDGWVKAVPEPTSGLLLLLGMAGLALRRRRA